MGWVLHYNGYYRAKMDGFVLSIYNHLIINKLRVIIERIMKRPHQNEL